MKLSGSCAVGSTARAGYGLLSGSFARPPPLGLKWKENWFWFQDRSIERDERTR